MILVGDLDGLLHFYADVLKVSLDTLFQHLADEDLAMAVPQPHFNEGLLFMFAEANATDILVKLVANHTEDEVLPDLIQNLALGLLLTLLELQQKASTFNPVFPPWLAFLLKKHDLYINFVFRWQFQ